MKVFCFEDQEEDLDILTYHLKKEFSDLKFHYSTNAEVSKDLLLKFLPDVILIDYFMENSTAEKILYQLKNIPELLNTPTILITSNENVTDIVECIKMGADDYISKSNISASMLKKAILSAIDKSELKKELDQTKLISMEKSQLASMGIIAGGVAHEINNPLSIISGTLNLVERSLEKNDIEKAKHYLAKAHQSVERMAEIVGSIKSFYNSMAHDKLAKVDVHSIIEKSIEFAKERFRTGRCELESTSEEGKLFVVANEIKISQIILNLLFNSLEALNSKNSPWVKITTETSGSNVIISVIDSGNGIPEASVSELFTPFYTTKKLGTGLGLPICLGIIKEIGGDLLYDNSSPNTKFDIIIPKA